MLRCSRLPPAPSRRGRRISDQKTICRVEEEAPADCSAASRIITVKQNTTTVKAHNEEFKTGIEKPAAGCKARRTG